MASSRPAAHPDLTGRVALVTGASSGLGERFARTLARAGATVVATARRTERLEALVAELTAEGHRAVARSLDVTDAAQIAEVTEEVHRSVGLVDLVVNNAGIPDARRAHKISVDLYDQVMATNLRAPWLISNEVARRLLAAQQPGSIVNISSMSAFHYGGEGAALYSVTKAAVARMTEVLAVEWSRFHINVNAIAPGAFRSEMMDGMLERMGDFTAALPRKRLGEPEQLDSTLLYLVDPASSAVTGTVIKVDDGQQAR